MRFGATRSASPWAARMSIECHGGGDKATRSVSMALDICRCVIAAKQSSLLSNDGHLYTVDKSADYVRQGLVCRTRKALHPLGGEVDLREVVFRNIDNIGVCISGLHDKRSASRQPVHSSCLKYVSIIGTSILCER